MSDALVMLDRALLGARFTVDRNVAGIGIRIRVLSPRELAEAGVLDADTTGFGAKAAATDQRIRHAVLALACSVVEDDLSPLFVSPEDVGRFPADVTRELWGAYQRAHAQTYTTDDAVEAAMNAREDEPRFELDAARARYASELVAYYGLRCALDATPVQVAWFCRLRKRSER